MRKIGTILCLVVLTGVLTACSGAGESTEILNQATDTLATEQKATEITVISDTKKEFNLYRDNIKIHGELHLPEGEGPFPVVVLANGFASTFSYQREYVRRLNEKGISAVIFDFIGTDGASRSGGTGMDRSLLNHAADLNLVMDEITTWPEIDSSRLFLWGHSFGGLVTTYVAGQRSEDIQGVILLEPSYLIADQYKEMFPEGTEIPVVVVEPIPVSKRFVEEIIDFDLNATMQKYQNEVIIFQGTVHSDEELAEMNKYFSKAVETFPNAKLVMIEGADHYFEKEPGAEMTGLAIEFIEDILNSQE